MKAEEKVILSMQAMIEEGLELFFKYEGQMEFGRKAKLAGIFDKIITAGKEMDVLLKEVDDTV